MARGKTPLALAATVTLSLTLTLALALALALGGTTGAAAAVPTPTPGELRPYDIESTYVSGVSSGGYLADQLHVAHSAVFKGAGSSARGRTTVRRAASTPRSTPAWTRTCRARPRRSWSS
ncbi:hypothetical protein ABZV77_37055 [Streptomyces sp. NPDC004732]|uniref:hypothetical protein n=1 Tax=Streptomyces sp. NPDC004732 TaxID=3154290 RepID=UPI0033AFA7F1